MSSSKIARPIPNMKKSQLILIAVFFAFSRAAVADPAQAQALFDKKSVRVGEEIRLTVQVANAAGNIQAPQIPALKNFDSFYTGRTSRINFINGVSSSLMEFSYVLVPRVAGQYTFGPVQVTAGGQVLQTQPVQLTVAKAPASTGPAPVYNPPVPQQPASSSSNQGTNEAPPTYRPDDDNIFVKATVDKTAVYPGEQILLTYAIYTRYDTRYEGFQEEPQTSGFWIEEFPMGEDVLKENVRINGKRYIRAEIKKMALFPTAVADYTIKPGVIKASIREEPQRNSVFDDFFNDSFFQGGGFFSRRVNLLLSPPPIQVKVRPLPTQGQPADFEGAVGNLNLRATIDKQQVKQNEPVTMTMVLEGDGNVETLNKPKIPELKNFKVYDSDTSSELLRNGNIIGGRKKFEIVFIPTEKGEQVIASMSFSHFNPVQNRYIVQKTPEFRLQVEPSDQTFVLPKELESKADYKKEIKKEAQDIHYLHENYESAKTQVWWGWIFQLFLWGSFVLTLLMLRFLFIDYREKVYSRHSGLKRMSTARRKAEEGIRKLKKMSGKAEGSQVAYFDQAERVMTEYVCDKFNLSTLGITRFELESKLAETLGSSDPLFKAVSDFYSFCDEARFGQGVVQKENQKEAIEILRSAIDRLEKVRR